MSPPKMKEDKIQEEPASPPKMEGNKIEEEPFRPPIYEANKDSIHDTQMDGGS